MGWISRHRHVGVHEVNRCAGFDAAQRRALPADATFGQAQCAPPDVRDAQSAAVGRGGRDGLNAAGDQPQAGVLAVLLTGVEQQLRADADAEKGPLRGNEAVERGAGEVLLTAVDKEGTRKGLDIELLRAVNARVNVPVIISGGYAEPADLARADAAGASGVAIADALHWDRSTLSVVKRQAHELGLEVRL